MHVSSGPSLLSAATGGPPLTPLRGPPSSLLPNTPLPPLQSRPDSSLRWPQSCRWGGWRSCCASRPAGRPGWPRRPPTISSSQDSSASPGVSGSTEGQTSPHRSLYSWWGRGIFGVKARYQSYFSDGCFWHIIVSCQIFHRDQNKKAKVLHLSIWEVFRPRLSHREFYLQASVLPASLCLKLSQHLFAYTPLLIQVSSFQQLLLLSK